MRILVSALEPSANLHLNYLLKKLEGVEITGIFDRAFGEPLYGMETFSVMGIADAAGKYFVAREAMARMVEEADGCEKVLLIDAPAFNLPLAKKLKRRYPNKEIIYYILPKVWAWKKRRAKEVARRCDVLAAVFPFETRFYPTAEYVGNPLLDELHVRRLPQAGTTAFLPGSRRSEITRLMPVFRETARRLPGKKVLAIPAFMDDARIAEWYGDIGAFEVVRDTQEAVAKAEFAFVCSGTATLETALIGTPFVMVYIARSWEYALAKRLVKIPYKGLANIILDFEGEGPMHEELFQEEVNCERLLDLYETLDREAFGQKSRRLWEILGHGSAERVAQLVRNGYN
ncbi:MAG: lipid-A-disaccharide synthase [Epsilonproteobacteria bacterium]|nr:lipid-A-disaccharide synthase [Campylobacterota bacterium]